MRLGQGFNSFTQQICIDNAVVGISDPEDSQPFVPKNPVADDPSAPVTTSPNKKPIEEIINDGPTTTVRYPSQIVTYTSKYVSKLSDVSNDLNVSGSLSIKYGEISGGGSGSYVNTETFQQSDINFLITVKVINQTINIKDQLQFWPLAGKAASTYDPQTFTNIYGDSFISGFQEGGQLSAIVSIKALDSSNMTQIKANAHLALQVGAGEVKAQADVDMMKKELNRQSEINITVNWSGGGQIKDNEKQWTIETLQEAAAKFPDLVANCPQRTHAILTKYTALRGYLQWRQANTLQPLDYEVASLYTSELLDVYMGYKKCWKDIQEMLQDLESEEDSAHALIKSPPLASRITMPQVYDNGKWVEGEVLDRYEPNFTGLDLALRHCRRLMVRIVDENDAISRDPTVAVDQTRPIAYLRPQIFRQLLPVHAPAVSLNVQLVPSTITFGETDTNDAIGTVGGFSNQTVPPEIIFGFNKIDLQRSSGRQIDRLYILEKTLNGYKFGSSSRALDGSSWCKRYTQTTASLVVPINDEGIQAGFWSMPIRTPTAGAQADFFVLSQRINFKYGYDQPPSVVAFLSGFDIETGGVVNACVSVAKIDKTGFDVVLTALNTVRTFDVSWFACSANAPNIICGTSDAPWASTKFTDLVASKPQEAFAGHVRLAPLTFSSPPKVFAALRGFAVTSGPENIRIQAKAADITKKGFNWRVDTWADTKFTAGAVSWIAWQE